MTTHYPVVYISTTNDEIVEYDWLEIGIQPYFFPNMELVIQGDIFSVVRVLTSRISDTQPVMYVLVAPCLKNDFVSTKHEEQVQQIYEFQMNQLAQQAKEDALGDDMTKALESYKWN